MLSRLLARLSPLGLLPPLVPLLLTLVEHAPAVVRAVRALPAALGARMRRLRPVQHGKAVGRAVGHRARTVARASHDRLHAHAKARYARRHAASPVSATVAEHLSLSDHIAIAISDTLGTMPTTVAFACISLVSLPAVIASHDPILIIAWVSQSFIQLVALPLLGIASRLGNRQSEAHVVALFAAQNRVLDEMLAQLAALRARDAGHDAQLAGLTADVAALQSGGSGGSGGDAPPAEPAPKPRSRRASPHSVAQE